MFYEIITKLCADRNVSIYDLERESGIGNGTIGKWKESSVQPNIGTLKKIADYFQITLETLLKKAE